MELMSVEQMSEADWDAWQRIQSSTPGLESGFFCPELTRAVAAVRSDVEIAVIRDGQHRVGFFPFQRSKPRYAQPIVGRLSEFHGLIAESTASISVTELLRTCGLKLWKFDHLPANQNQLVDCIWGVKPSPYMDLSQGYDSYRTRVKANGSSLSQAERKGRKLGREIGELRFEYDSSDPAVLEALIDWKTQQHQRTNVLQVMKVDWVRSLLERLPAHQSDFFSAPRSALFAGDKLVAVHLGLQSRSRLHIWFPAYSTEYEKYSPGSVLLLRMAQHAAELGVQQIDMGPGEERYKQNFKTGDLNVAVGAMDQGRISHAMQRAYYQLKCRIRTSPWRRQLEFPLVATRRIRQWMAFR